jgi:transposase
VFTPAGAAKRALRSVAQRWLTLHDETTALTSEIKHVLDTIAPSMLERHGVGYETTGTLLCAAGDNPERLHTEAGYAALCGTNLIRVSSGKTNRHRLNRAGDRHANSALWTIDMVRIPSNHEPTISYIKRRTTEGLTKREAIRCLKRYIAREFYNDIRTIIATTTTTPIAA